nr:hypothetical protein [Pandoravirus aubagnensis]
MMRLSAYDCFALSMDAQTQGDDWAAWSWADLDTWARHDDRRDLRAVMAKAWVEAKMRASETGSRRIFFGRPGRGLAQSLDVITAAVAVVRAAVANACQALHPRQQGQRRVADWIFKRKNIFQTKIQTVFFFRHRLLLLASLFATSAATNRELSAGRSEIDTTKWSACGSRKMS